MNRVENPSVWSGESSCPMPRWNLGDWSIATILRAAPECQTQSESAVNPTPGVEE